MSIFLKAIICVAAITLFWIVFFGGVSIMTKISGHDYVIRQLHEKANRSNGRQLNLRLCGYNVDAVDEHWGILDNKAQKIEQHFLKLDLVFPVVYGTALLLTILLTWLMAGKPFSAIWIIGAIIILIIADWTENHIQLSQLQLYMDSGKVGLEAGLIQIASGATTIKIIFFVSMALLSIILTLCTIIKPTT